MESTPSETDKVVYKRKFIVDHIIERIESGKLVVGASVPSLNEIRELFGVSRMTVVNAYSDLKEMGVIRSIPRKGFRVAKSKNIAKHRVFLFLDELNSYKKVLYESFKNAMGSHGSVDVYFHHFNASVFENLIVQNLGNYTAFVVLPTVKKNCSEVLKRIPEGKLYILDFGFVAYGRKYPSVCQNYERYIKENLTSVMDLLVKYNKYYLVHPGKNEEPDLIRSFHAFCRENKMENEWLPTLSDRKPKAGECYFVFVDNDLINLIYRAEEEHLEIGKDVGVISYNDAPIKGVVANGITVMSTNFQVMGETMADMVLNKRTDHVENPSYIIRRKSL